MVGSAARALEKMGEGNPMFKPIFFASRTECCAQVWLAAPPASVAVLVCESLSFIVPPLPQIQWLHEQGAFPTSKVTSAGEVRTLKLLKQAEANLVKYKQAYCDKMRKELKRLNQICKQCNVPAKHPVTQQQTKIQLVHASLVQDYPPTTDVFKCVEEVARLSKAIFDHKEVVLNILQHAQATGVLSRAMYVTPCSSSSFFHLSFSLLSPYFRSCVWLPPHPLHAHSHITEEVPYHELKTIIEQNPQVNRYQEQVRCTTCHSFFRETVGKYVTRHTFGVIFCCTHQRVNTNQFFSFRCWCCGGCAELEFG